jgi:zinc transporter 7
MVAFAVGGLLGDTLFHLLPEIFVGEDSETQARFVLVEPNRNLLLGVAILVGFMTFVAMDKGLRIATGGAGHDHSHGHSHESSSAADAAVTSALDTPDTKGVKSRAKGVDAKTSHTQVSEAKEINPSVKLGGYLNLM